MAEEMDQTQQMEQLASNFMEFFTAWEIFWDDIITNFAQFNDDPLGLMADYENLLNAIYTSNSASTSDTSDSGSDSSTEDDDEEEDSSMDEDSYSVTNLDSNIDDSSSEADSLEEEYEDLFYEQFVEYNEYYEVEEDDWPMDHQDGCY